MDDREIEEYIFNAGINFLAKSYQADCERIKKSKNKDKIKELDRKFINGELPNDMTFEELEKEYERLINEDN